jgi:hypothetical protein
MRRSYAHFDFREIFPVVVRARPGAMPPSGGVD